MVTGGVERMRIDAAGKVGIGTLHVTGSLQYQTRLLPLLDGSQSSCAAPSAKFIQENYGITTDGVYWIYLPTAGPTQIYCIMNPACGGGGWMMAYKATRGTTFAYTSNYWTTTNTLNTTDTTRNDADAKFHTANYFPARDWLAIFPDAPVNGGDVPGGYGGWTWMEANATNTVIPIVSFFSLGYTVIKLSNGIIYSRTEPTPMASPKYSSSLWTPELGFQAFALNYNKAGFSAAYIRWGFCWNNENDQATNDNSAGIGSTYSAGDAGAFQQSTAGVNRSMRFEWYVR